MIAAPQIVFSHCLQRQLCRYNAERIESPLVTILSEFVQFLPVCPEVAIGLPTPRPPIQIESVAGALRLIRPSDGADLTEAMARFADAFLDRARAVDGFLLKARSPSCGVGDARLVSDAGGETLVDGRFAAAVRQRFPSLATATEQQLCAWRQLDQFLSQSFLAARARQVQSATDCRALHDALRWIVGGHSGRGYHRLASLCDQPMAYRAALLQLTETAPPPRAWRRSATDWLAEHKHQLTPGLRRWLRRALSQRTSALEMTRQSLLRRLVDEPAAPTLFPTLCAYPLGLARALIGVKLPPKGYQPVESP